MRGQATKSDKIRLFSVFRLTNQADKYIIKFVQKCAPRGAIGRIDRLVTDDELFLATATDPGNCPHLSLGTVYRNLNLLVDIGQLRRIGVPGEADRYDWQLEPHQHLFCRRCKKVLNLAMQSDALEALVQSCPGIQAEDYNFIVTGLCPDCKQHPDAQGDASANS